MALLLGAPGWVVSPSVASPTEEPVPEATMERRAFLEVTVNGVSKGEALVILGIDEAWIGDATLEEFGVTADAESELRAGATGTMVALSSLAPDVTYELDEKALMLRLAVQSNRLGHTTLDLTTRRPPDLEYARSSGGFVNYSVGLAGARPDLFLESGVTVGPALFTSTASQAPGGGFVRGVSNVSFGDRARLRRWTVGDSFASTGDLGGGGFIGGISLTREYSLDPYRVHHPSVGLTGATPTPSTVEVYVNNHLVRRDQVPAGEFELHGLPVTAGRGDARVVVRDAFGRVQEIGAPYYLVPSLLQPGLHEYGYHVGTQRSGVGTQNWHYAGPVFLGRHRYGVTNWLTVGGRVEATSGLVSGGPSLTGRTPLGEVTVAGALSRDGGWRGWAGALGYGFTSRRLSVGLGVRLVSERYATVSLRGDQERISTESNLSMALQLPRTTSLVLRHTFAKASSETADRLVSSATINTRLSQSSTVAVSVDRVGRLGRIGWDLSTGLNLYLGGSASAGVSVDRVEDDIAAGFELQRSAPVGTGYGYRLQAQESQRGGAMDGFAEYQGPSGRYEFRQASLDGTNAASVRASGALVMIGGGLHATRPVRDGYALVRVPGIEGVRAYASNQEIGRTNGNGDVLVPNLLSNYANRLRIEDQDVPLDFVLASPNRTVAPPYRGGAIVSFPVRLRRAAVGRLQLTNAVEATIPAYGAVSTVVDDEPMSSPIGANGEFYFEFLPPGRYPATVAYRGGRCDLTLDVPEHESPMTDIGLVACAIGGDYVSPSLHVDARARDEPPGRAAPGGQVLDQHEAGEFRPIRRVLGAAPNLDGEHRLSLSAERPLDQNRAGSGSGLDLCGPPYGPGDREAALRPLPGCRRDTGLGERAGEHASVLSAEPGLGQGDGSGVRHRSEWTGRDLRPVHGQGDGTRTILTGPSVGGEYAVQVAAFRSAASATALAYRLADAAFPAYVLEPQPADSPRLYRVRTGDFPDRSSAETAGQRVADEQALGWYVVALP